MALQHPELVHSLTIHEPAYVGFVTDPRAHVIYRASQEPQPAYDPECADVGSNTRFCATIGASCCRNTVDFGVGCAGVRRRRRGSGVATIDIIMAPAAPINAAMVVDNATFAMNRRKR